MRTRGAALSCFSWRYSRFRQVCGLPLGCSPFISNFFSQWIVSRGYKIQVTFPYLRTSSVFHRSKFKYLVPICTLMGSQLAYIFKKMATWPILLSPSEIEKTNSYNYMYNLHPHTENMFPDNSHYPNTCPIVWIF